MKPYKHLNYLMKRSLYPESMYVATAGLTCIVIAATLLPSHVHAGMRAQSHLATEVQNESGPVNSNKLGDYTIHENIPEEPVEYDPKEVKSYYDWRNDMFFREFDLGGMGRVDFMTARRIYKVSLNEFGNSVVMTMPYPLFYWVDANNNGKFEPKEGEMWSDPEEDGLNGNEKLYGI